MTRLTGEDIRDIGTTLKQYDENLIRKTGRPLKQIAVQAADISEKAFEDALVLNVAAVVTITCGQGMIESFAESVRAILHHLGARTVRPEGTDIAGIAEAIEQGATVVFCSDDDRFVAINLPLLRVVDNTEATARGYVTALELMAGGLSGCQVLVIGGAGQLGWKAINLLETKGAKVAAFDVNQSRLKELTKGRRIGVERDLQEALRRHSIFFDASPASNIIRPEHIQPETLIAAPGIPLGCTLEAYDLVKDRLIHDPLQIGVATMLAEALQPPRWVTSVPVQVQP
jgi:pyrrolysine biosynthesis protein PylD